MTLDEMIKYLIWVIFFGIIFVGLFFMLKKAGVV